MMVINTLLLIIIDVKIRLFQASYERKNVNFSKLLSRGKILSVEELVCINCLFHQISIDRHNDGIYYCFTNDCFNNYLMFL